MGTSPDSHLHPLDHNLLELDFITLFVNFDSERVFGDSLEERISSSGSLEALLSNIEGELCRGPYALPDLKRGGNTSQPTKDKERKKLYPAFPEDR